MKKTTVLIMFGGKSTEYEVSLRSAYSILSNIDRDKYDVVTLGVTREGKWLYYCGSIEEIPTDKWHENHVLPAMLVPDCGCKLLHINGDKPEDLHIDVVFPVMHGSFCEDGKMQGLFEICGLPYVGPGCLSSAVGMDKVFTKLVLNNFDVPQADSLHFTSNEIKSGISACVAKVEYKFEYPVFVKPSNAGSSIGTCKVKSGAEIKDALVNAAKFDSKILVEEYITAKEIEVAVMGNGTDLRVSRCGEINPGSDYYDYDTKYKTNTSSVCIPADIPSETESRVREYAKRIYTVLGCSGLSRVDFFVCENDRIVFNEINTLPGFTTISMYPKLFINEGMEYSEIIENLIELALKK